MRAYYYKIIEYTEASCMKGAIVDEGIIRNSEDTIYPRQNTGIKELPYECECHHFNIPNYRLEGWEISLTRQDVQDMKATYQYPTHY